MGIYRSVGIGSSFNATTGQLNMGGFRRDWDIHLIIQ
jgi:hypothetical protein